MHVPSAKSKKTRDRLLVAACRIFAEKGLQEATIAEICELAQTNIAAVNYHFRDKESLYLETWRYAFKKELEAHPAEGGATSDASAEVRLAGRISSLIARIADDRSYSFAIINKEMANPSRLLTEILDKEINPLRLEMLSLIKECLGPDADDQQLSFCHASIMGQCFHLLKMKHLQQNTAANLISDLSDTPAFINHVITFSLAGIRAVRKQISDNHHSQSSSQ